MAVEYIILAVNPGSTSTKIALFKNNEPVFQKKIEHDENKISKFDRIVDQLEFRSDHVKDAIVEAGYALSGLSAVVGRGGLLRPLESGTYQVNDAMKEDLIKAARGEHASNLGALIADRIASEAGVPAYIVDPVSVDEMDPVARISGFKPVERTSLSHALNMKAVAKRFAKESGNKYESLKLVVAHMGSGISISAHADGRMVDVINPREEGPFSTERAGSLPVLGILKYAMNNKKSFKDMDRALFREGGLYSYLGTKDLRKIREKIENGDEYALLIVSAMAYQAAKDIAAMTSVLRGEVDAILLTGGMMYDELLADDLTSRVSFLCDAVKVYAGEDELLALAEGALRVLSGEEKVKEY